MVLLQPDPFLNELTKLFEKTKSRGTVWLTMKRTNLRKKPKKDDAGADPASENPSLPEPDDDGYRCIVRATDGKKKISTLLGPKEHLRFQASYATVLKAHMDSLKRKEKKDKKDKKKSQPKPQ